MQRLMIDIDPEIEIDTDIEKINTHDCELCYYTSQPERILSRPS